jgi:serine/threonine-protein kinase
MTAAPDADNRAPMPADSEVRRAVLERRLATDDEVRHCEAILDRQRKRTPGGSLSQVLVEYQYITQTQMRRLANDLAAAARSPGGDGAGGVPSQIPGYQIISKLGAGAMAVVYKAKQINLDRVVAIKILPKRLSANAEFVDRFQKEGKAAAKLNHPNIVQAIDVGVEPGGFHYFVMEYVEGVTVFDELEKGPYEESEALRLITQVAEALDHAHAKGFIHRDVKPKNIMVTPDRKAKLADMGLAREKDDVASAEMEKGRAYGTPYYIAPEQIRGEVDIDFRADIYSLGATLYHMVTGRVPFDGATPTEVMRRHLKEELVPPDHIITTLSSGMSQVIEVMMRKKREERYKTTKDLLLDLQDLAGGRAPRQAQERFNLGDLAMLEQSADDGLSSDAVSKHVLRAQYEKQLAEMRQYLYGSLGLAGLFLLATLALLVKIATD